MKTTFQVRIDKDLKKAFVEAAKSNDRTGAQLLRDYIREYVKKNNQPELKL